MLTIDIKNKAWKYATTLVVALIIFNPEMAELAIFIDAVGLEIFFLLLEVQSIVILETFRSRMILAFANLKKLYKNYMPKYHCEILQPNREI